MPQSAGSIGLDIVANSSGLLRSVEVAARRADNLLRRAANGTAVSIGDIFSRSATDAAGRVARSLSRAMDGVSQRLGGSLSSALDTSRVAEGAAVAAKANRELQRGAESAQRAVTRQEERMLVLSAAMDKATGAAEETRSRMRGLRDELAALAAKTSGEQVVNAEEYHAAILRMGAVEEELRELEALWEKQAKEAEKAGNAYLSAAEKLEVLKAKSATANEELASAGPGKGGNAVVGILSSLASGAAMVVQKIAAIVAIVAKLMGAVALLGVGIAALAVRFTYLSATGEQPIAALSHLAGMAETLRASISNLSATLQAVVITAFMQLAEAAVAVANTVVNAINSILMAIGGFLNRATGGMFNTVLEQVTQRQNNLAKAQTGAAKAAGAQNRAQKALNRTLASFDRIIKLEAAASSGGGGGGAGGGISDTFGTLPEAVDMAAELGDLLAQLKLPDALVESFQHLGDALARLGEVLGGGLSWAWENILKPLGEWTMNELAPRLVELLANALDLVSTALDALYPLWDALWRNILEPFAKFLGDVLLFWLDRINEGLQIMKNAIETYVGPAIEWLADKLDEVAAAFSEFFDWVGKEIDKAKESLAEIAGAIEETMMGASAEVTDFFAQFIDKFSLEPGHLGSGNPLLGEEALANLQNATELSEKLAGTWEGIGDRTVTLDAQYAVTAEQVKQGWTARIGNWKDKTATLSYKYSNTAAAWKESWTKRTNVAFYNRTGDKAPKISFQYSNTAAAWKAGWENRLKVFHDKKATITYDVKATGIKSLEAKAYYNGKQMSSINMVPKYFAQGGWVARNTPQLAVIGDNTREGEIVSPESKFQTMLDKAVASGGGSEAVEALLADILATVRGMDTGTYLDGKAITRAVVGNINSQVQSTGRSPLLV